MSLNEVITDDMSRIVQRIDAIDPLDVTAYGGKAVGLARMAVNGIPIPPAFVVSTAGFHLFRQAGRVPDAMARAVLFAVDALAVETGRAFGGDHTPLLVSVRSGAAVSMPGMMDTILNLGLDRAAALALAAETGNPAFVLDSWARFWGMYAGTVLGLDSETLLDAIAPAKAAALRDPGESSFAAFEDAAIAALAEEGETVSRDPREHLIATVAAVFRSWDSARAKAYRKHHGIPDDMGTAVTIQSMVFGNMDLQSGTGVAFTRDPNTGERTLYGEYLVGHQGEDLVAGTHTPIKLSDAAMPAAIAKTLARNGDRLETIYGDAVDIEFTVQSGTLYFLQVRAAKRTSAAAIRIALDQMDEGLIDRKVAMRRVTTDQIAKLMRPGFAPAALKAARVLATGLGSSPGQAMGAAYLDSDMAARHADAGEDVILLRPITSPQDIKGMLSANGIVTVKGGALSHAAVVSRALDKPCIVGCDAIDIDLSGRTFTVGGETFPEGTAISIDGTDGRVFIGAIPVTAAGSNGPALMRFLATAREATGADVWSVTRNEAETRRAVAHGATGLGLMSIADLIISSGTMDSFSEGIAQLTRGTPVKGLLDQTAALVREACAPLFAAADGLPVHLRFPQLRSERARDLVANWEDIPPAQFLPLGSLDLTRAMLRGISDAQADTGVSEVTVFSGGFTDPMEFQAFRAVLSAFGSLSAGLLVQNTVLLFRLAASAGHDAPVWIDVNEIIRTAHGYPMHVLQMPSILDDYRAAGRLAVNPLRDTDGILAGPLRTIGAAGAHHIGIAGAGGLSDEFLDLLHRARFRRFSAQAAGADLVGVRLARLSKE
jgi:pyruvate, orthophosphate dikinase